MVATIKVYIRVEDQKAGQMPETKYIDLTFETLEAARLLRDALNKNKAEIIGVEYNEVRPKGKVWN